MKRGHILWRHRLAAGIMLVAVLAMLVHMAVPHHHHARYVALACLHIHPAEHHGAPPHCPQGDTGCQSEDTADCQPCDSLGQSALRPAPRHPHNGGMTLPHPLLPHDFIPASPLLCPSPLVAGNGAHAGSSFYSHRFSETAHGLSCGLRAPPRGC